MSIINKYFDDIADAMTFFDELAFEKNDFIFRGHKDEKYKLTTTLYRLRRVPHHAWSSDIEEMINYFRVGIAKLGLLTFQSDNRLDWLEYARHHGVPTPIINFTYSPYIATFFAFNGVRKDFTKKEKEYSVVCALNIKNLAMLWAKLCVKYSPKEDDEVMKSYNQFLNPDDSIFKDCFPGPWLQFIPFPGKHNYRMHRQQGALLYDTLDYTSLHVENLDELIEKYVEPDTHLPDGTIKKEEPTLYKIFINKACVSDVFSRLELMGINGGFLYMNADGVAQDAANSYYYYPKISYLRDIRFLPPDDVKI